MSSYKIDLDRLIAEFIDMVNEDSSSDSDNVKRVKIIRDEDDCCGSLLDELMEEE